MGAIGTDLADQFDRAFEMIRETIERFTPEQWIADDHHGQPAAWWGLHAVETVGFYMRPEPQWPPHNRQWVGEEPSQQELLAYLADLQVEFRAILVGWSDGELLSTANAFPWTGATVLQRMLYLLRHTMTHQGEMSMLLRFYGADETVWV